MFHTLPHKLPAARPARADCPRCGGYPELDETGRPYTCYFCCDTGYVPAEVAEAFYRAEDDMREQFAPRHVDGCWQSMRYDEEGPTGLRYRPLFTGLLPMPYHRAVVPHVTPFADDIPF